MKKPIRRIVVLTTGFATRESTQGGIRDLYLEVRKRIASPDTYVMLRTWKQSMTDVAKIIEGDAGRKARIDYIGHSYGAGVAFPKFCKQLAKRGRRVTHAVLIDPVPQAPWPPNLAWKRLFGFKSVLHVINHGWDTITLPFNVQSAQVFRQTNNIPMGRIVKGPRVTSTVYGLNLDKEPGVSGETTILTSLVDHESIDSHEDVRKHVVSKL
jgi:pimeloyl-ACP methyl ester carboxylesterase